MHEVIDEEARADPTLRTKLVEMIESEQLPPSYFDNPVVQAAEPGEVLPLQMFVDGLPYSLVDSVCGIWIINMVSGRHHCIGQVRKRMCCKCGCAGWDTFFPIYCALL